jgi:hypothetical protein
METRGAEQALMMTTKYPQLTLDLVHTAYREHIWSLDCDYRLHEGCDVIFFAILKLASKEKLEFAPALAQVSKMCLVDA